MITFAVSEVERAGNPLPEVDARTVIEALGGGPVEAWWRPAWPLVEPWLGPPLHPFVAAAHAAFDEHRPLELSPDAVWLCIAQGIATHVRVNAEALRGRIVDHRGRETIAVRRDAFRKGSPDNDWPGVFTELSDEVGRRTGDLHGLVVADFSTTDATSRAVSELALLSLASPYFVYQVCSGCGIPSVTLTGSVEDWRAIRARAEALAFLDVDAWLEALLPMLDQLVESAAGRPDVELWRSFYKLKGESGGPYVTGWINTLLPYLIDHRGAPRPNEHLASWRDGLTSPFGGGPSFDQLSSGLSRVPFLWKHFFDEHRMELLGGFAGVGQDPATLTVRPELGWAVRDAR